MTVKKYLPALIAIALSFTACPQPDMEPVAEPVAEPVVEYRNTVEYTAAGTGPLSLTVDGQSLNLAVDENGNISLQFPEAARDFAGKTKTLAIPAADAQKIYENRAEAIISVTPPPPY
jgi:hypothetical protein